MMSAEIIDLPPTLDAITPEKGNGRRYSTGQTHVSVDGKKSMPHYLRASTGSCHDLCKYGWRNESETKPWSSACRRKKIEEKPPEMIFTTVEVLTDGKNYLKAKLKSSTDGKVRLPDSSSASKQKLSTYEKRTLQSNEGKSKAASVLKSSVVPTRLSNPGATVKEQILPDIEISKLVSVKVTERGTPGKSGTHSRTKAAIPMPTPSSKSPQSLGLSKEDRKVVENTRIPDRIRVKNAVISSTSPMPLKSSVGSAQTSIKRQVWKQKTAICQRNQKIAEDRGIQRIEVEVPEKTLYVIDVETNYKSMNFGESNIDMGVPSPFPSPSLSVAGSSALQDSSAIMSHSEGKEETEKSNIQYSSQEEDGDDGDDDDDDDDDDEWLEYTDDELEVYSNLELDENKNEEKEVISVGRSVERRPRKEGTVHPEGMDSDPVKLRFRRGKVVEIKSEDNAPQRLKFRRRRLLGENEARTGVQKRSLKKRDITDGNDDVFDPSSEKYALRQSSVQGKKDAQGLFNNVIEETASKLAENRISKVKALVGAFETVISLQDGKPAATD